MSRKNKKQDYLDTETTFADMDVDGMRGSSGNKNTQKQPIQKVNRKEYWQMVRGMFASIAPAVIIFILAMSFTALLLWLWLK